MCNLRERFRAEEKEAKIDMNMHKNHFFCIDVVEESRKREGISVDNMAMLLGMTRDRYFLLCEENGVLDSFESRRYYFNFEVI